MWREKACAYVGRDGGVEGKAMCYCVLVPLCVEIWVWVLRVRWTLGKRHMCVQRHSCRCAK